MDFNYTKWIHGKKEERHRHVEQENLHTGTISELLPRKETLMREATKLRLCFSISAQDGNRWSLGERAFTGVWPSPQS